MANKSSNESRRKFLKVVPAAVAGAVATKAFAQGPPQTAGPVTAETIKTAETLDGVQFTSEEEAAAARGANTNLANYTRMRAITVPQDTEPAYVFKPSLPGKEPKGPATPGAPHQIHEAARDAEAAGQPRGRRVLARSPGSRRSSSASS